LSMSLVVIFVYAFPQATGAFLYVDICMYVCSIYCVYFHAGGWHFVNFETTTKTMPLRLSL